MTQTSPDTAAPSSATASQPKLNRYSSTLTQQRKQGASLAMLYAVGLRDEDFDKPQVGIVAIWYEGNPCNMHLLDLAAQVQEGVQRRGLVGMRFNTIGVSDGISMGTDGMSYSLQSRDLIADSIETVMGAQWYDGLIALPGCDKNMPGCLMAMGRLNRPAHHGLRRHDQARLHTLRTAKMQKLDIVSAFQSYGEYIAGHITEEERQDDRPPRLPRRRCLRRHVHRQHHGHRHRSDGHVAALLQLALPPKTR